MAGGDDWGEGCLSHMYLSHMWRCDIHRNSSTAQIYDMYFQGLVSEISNPGEEQSFVTRVDADDPGIVMDSPKDGAVTVVG